MSRFLQQRLAELLSLVIGKSQAHAPLNMTILVYWVILYHASFWFAMGVEKNILILTKNYFPLTHYFMKALLSFRQRTAPLKSKMHPPLNRSCTPFDGFYQNYGSLPAGACPAPDPLSFMVADFLLPPIGMIRWERFDARRDGHFPSWLFVVKLQSRSISLFVNFTMWGRAPAPNPLSFIGSGFFCCHTKSCISTRTVL